MRVVDSRLIYFVLSIVSFYLSSFSIAFMPLASFDDESKRGFSAVLAAVFWLFLLAGIALTFRVRKQRVWDNKHKPRPGRLPHPLRLFSNKPAGFFEVLFFIGVFFLIISQVTLFFPDWFMWEVMFITVFSFQMHFVFSGKNYHWLSTLPGRGRRVRG